MFIRRVELSNIRSYEFQQVMFTGGITLLCGDIGSGKTTILMAIEFALFGILRGKTSVHELLRHSAKEGYVLLDCEIQGKNILIKRSLKRSSDGINQKEGMISINGEEEVLTPTELKARVLELLGYPDSLLNKSTNLFRYTVYTPQEQVKLILHESPEERKDVIRKIFDIDKYKRVAENSLIYLSDVKERIGFLRGQTDDVKILQEQLSAQKIELDRLQILLPRVKKELDVVKEERERLEKEQVQIDAVLKAYQQEENTYKLLQQTVRSKEEFLTLVQNQIREKEDFLKNFSQKEIVFDVSKKEKLSLAFEKLSEAKRSVNNKKGALEAQNKSALQLSQTISSLDQCPMCKQTVSSDHKNNINKEQEALLEVVKKKTIFLDEFSLQISQKEKLLNEKRIFIEKEEQEYLLFDRQKKQFFSTQKALEDLLKKREETLGILGKVQVDLISQKKFLDDNKPVIPVDLIKYRDQARENELKKQQEYTQISTSLQLAQKSFDSIKETLLKKAEIAKRMDELSLIKHWVLELFSPLVKTIEKRVLLKVYHEFNEYFMQWFSILIDDDAFSVRLNEDFTPLIEQNGFDTSLSNLSGGEKTALALAYRLALNKVLNTYFGSLHTKDLLILDEPTDGFSTEQIDRLREVFSQLQLSQLILVSHEQKLESLATHVIRVQKRNQLSIVN
jgi:DNA repair protein SbcC/Rad50